MKKLMVLATVAVAAVAAHAASFTWASTDKVYGVTVSAVGDNGPYNAGGQALSNSAGAFTYVLSLYDDGGTLVDTVKGDVKFSTTGNKFKTSIVSAKAGDGVEYDYVLAITGTQKTLTNKESAEYDYTAATLSTSISGTIKTASSGDTDFTTAVPTSWTVSGVAAVPEPTSGLLLLLGVAGLALRRRRA